MACLTVLMFLSHYTLHSFLSDERGAVSDYQSGHRTDRLETRGHQISPQRTLLGCTGKCELADVTAGWALLPSTGWELQYYMVDFTCIHLFVLKLNVVVFSVHLCVCVCRSGVECTCLRACGDEELPKWNARVQVWHERQDCHRQAGQRWHDWWLRQKVSWMTLEWKWEPLWWVNHWTLFMLVTNLLIDI